MESLSYAARLDEYCDLLSPVTWHLAQSVLHTFRSSTRGAISFPTVDRGTQAPVTHVAFESIDFLFHTLHTQPVLCMYSLNCMLTALSDSHSL